MARITLKKTLYRGVGTPWELYLMGSVLHFTEAGEPKPPLGPEEWKDLARHFYWLYNRESNS